MDMPKITVELVDEGQMVKMPLGDFNMLMERNRTLAAESRVLSTDNEILNRCITNIEEFLYSGLGPNVQTCIDIMNKELRYDDAAPSTDR